MSDYILSCSSSADLSDEWFNKRGIVYVCFHFNLGGIDYPDDMGKTVSSDELFRRMNDGEDTKTSQITVSEYTEHFEKYLKEGKDVIHVCLSTGITGTYNSACVARDTLAEEYPDRKIYVIDSLSASSGFGLLVELMADKRDEGMNIDELYNWTEKNKKKLIHWFFSSDLTFFIRGGRISKTSGTIGNILNICPLMNVDSTGHLIVREKVRTKKKVIK
nr:DegV family protein [Lachnospiraceae bacterium]